MTEEQKNKLNELVSKEPSSFFKESDKRIENRKKDLTIRTIGNAVFIKSEDFYFMYDKEISNDPIANDVTNIYSYFGGLQCNYEKDSFKYNKLHDRLCRLANNILIEKIWFKAIGNLL